MNLDDEQKRKVTEWIAQGLKLSEIQKRLGDELGLRLTYMEARLLVDDLKLMPKDTERPKPMDLSGKTADQARKLQWQAWNRARKPQGRCRRENCPSPAQEM